METRAVSRETARVLFFYLENQSSFATQFHCFMVENIVEKSIGFLFPEI